MSRPDVEAWDMVRRLATEGEVAERMGDLSRASGLTPGMLKAVLHLQRQAHPSMRDLARTLGCDPSYLTGLVDELAARGLAERQSHPDDRRVKTVVLTPEGVELAQRVQATLGVPPAGFATLTKAEAAQLAALLAKVSEPSTQLTGAGSRHAS